MLIKRLQQIQSSQSETDPNDPSQPGDAADRNTSPTPDKGVLPTEIMPGTAPLPRNTILQGRYDIEQVIGIGGMSTVYKARDLRFNTVARFCAIKEMPDTAPDPRTGQLRLAVFEREASLLATLSHPGITKIYDFFPSHGRVYLVLEYIDGKDLETQLDLRKAPMQEDEVVKWAVQICEVLEYLHGHHPQPIVFRDMKPSNIIVAADGKVTLIDFGIAKVFQSDKRGTMIGTEGYAPPEQYRGLSEPRGDIYALGATMHHLLTNFDPRTQTPFTFQERPIRNYNSRVSEYIDPSSYAQSSMTLTAAGPVPWHFARRFSRAVSSTTGKRNGSRVVSTPKANCSSLHRRFPSSQALSPTWRTTTAQSPRASTPHRVACLFSHPTSGHPHNPLRLRA